MSSKIYIITDLGPGDGGKGGVVHRVATMTRAHTVLKRGGAQGSHGVRTSRGERFNFSQWGCGTFEAIPTFLTDQIVVSPLGLLNEADALRHNGISDPFRLLKADQNAICATPYHGISSRIKELAKGANPRGTIGTGIGEAYRYAEIAPELTLRLSDLGRPGLSARIADVRSRIRTDLEPLLSGEFLSSDLELLEEERRLLYDDGFLAYVVDIFKETIRQIRFATLDEILSRNGVAVVECSHGILTDSEVGLKPHVSAIRTLPRFTTEMLRAAGYDGQIVNLAVHRAYSIRHGAGPLPTAIPAMNDLLLPGSHKNENRWQGKVRVGPLDLPLLRYAVDLCGGVSAFDGLCLTWFDQIVKNGLWSYCPRYENLELNAETAPLLGAALPTLRNIPICPNLPLEEYGNVVAEVLDSILPVRMVSFGPTELDKFCR